MLHFFLYSVDLRLRRREVYTLIYSTRLIHCITSITITLVFFAIEVFTLYEIFFITLLSFHVKNVKEVKFQNEVCDLATGRWGGT